MFTIVANGKSVYLGKKLPNEYIYSKTTEKLGKERRLAKQKAAPGIGEMIEIASNERWEAPVHKNRHFLDAKYGFYKYATRFAVIDRNGEYETYDAELVIRHDADGKLYLYDIQGIKKIPPRSGFRSIRANQICSPERAKRPLTVLLIIVYPKQTKMTRDFHLKILKV